MRSIPRQQVLSALLATGVSESFMLGCKQAKPGAAETTTTAVSTEAQGPLKVAFAYVGPVGDAGWTYAHNQGRLAAQKEFGEKVATSFVENVPEAADAERVIRDLVAQGNKLIFGTTFGYMEQMLKVAKDSPDVHFEHATGYKQAKNLRTYNARMHEGAYMAGVVAGAMTKTKTLGVVASIPIPEVIRNINSFTLGAQTVAPDVTTKVVWVNSWFDPSKEGEAARALIDQSADVLLQNTDSSAVLQTAAKLGKFAFGWDSDMSKFGPKAHLASSIINWAPYYKKAVGDALAGTWSTGDVWWGHREGMVDLVSLSSQIPPEVVATIDTIKQGLKAGTFEFWKGPITNQEGKVVISAGETVDDKFLLGMNFYVKGVEGKLPAGN